MRRLPTPLLFLLLLLLIVVAFLALDFKAAQSNTTANSQVGTIRSGEGYNERPPLVVYIQAPENLSNILKEELVDRLAARGPFSTVQPIENPAPTPDSAALVVVVERNTYIWTPVYATAELEVQLAFASDGQVDWNDLGEVNSVMQASPEVRISGTLAIADSSWGLISHPAYRRHIAGQISDRVVETVNTIQTNPSP